jgi:uncharacterized protein
MAKPVPTDPPRIFFDCGKCPAYCCSVYDRVAATKRDVARLARHFGVSFEVAEQRYTRIKDGERVLKRVKDVIFEKTCVFLDQNKRCCTIYHARPAVCREFPGRARCAYYDLLAFERKQQGDDTVVPLVQITFQESPAAAEAVPTRRSTARS